jgi:purine-binding chemotaxis protein CheW
LENQKNHQHEMEGDLNQLISFEVGEEEYGLDILRVKEVIRIREITRLPKAPSFVKGIINLRGDVIPIIDLRDKFGLEHQEYTDTTRVIVVDVEDKLVGMVVDAASQVVRVPADQIEPPPPIVGGLSTEYIRGVGKLDERLVILLNIDRILTQEEKVQLKEMEQSVRMPAGSSGSTAVKSAGAEADAGQQEAVLGGA